MEYRIMLSVPLLYVMWQGPSLYLSAKSSRARDPSGDRLSCRCPCVLRAKHGAQQFGAQ